MKVTFQSNPVSRHMMAGGILLACAMGVVLMPRIAQWNSYHNFADKRVIFGIPHFGDVITNLAFLVAGLYGWKQVSSASAAAFRTTSERSMYGAFCCICMLLCFGSGYYHWSPSNETLFWDRGCMAAGFTALFAIFIAERVDASFGSRCFWPMIAAGVSAAYSWRLSEDAKRGDLRYYVAAQYIPVVMVPVLLLLYKHTYTQTYKLWLAFGLLLFSKGVEFVDRLTFWLTLHTISGHAIHHLAAAAAMLVICSYAVNKRPIAEA